jgi:hypothetical protein
VIGNVVAKFSNNLAGVVDARKSSKNAAGDIECGYGIGTGSRNLARTQ